jgi:hypothetical protein
MPKKLFKIDKFSQFSGADSHAAFGVEFAAV